MRDLQADLEICNKATPGPWIHRNGVLPEVVILEKEEAFNLVAECPGNINAAFIAAARKGWPHAIERAINAEAEVERLKLMVKSITEGLDEAIETNQYLGKQLDKAIEDIEILCTKHYELADDYDKLSDICQDFCLHTEGKCFKAAADNPNRCAKFRWRG